MCINRLRIWNSCSSHCHFARITGSDIATNYQEIYLRQGNTDTHCPGSWYTLLADATLHLIPEVIGNIWTMLLQ